ncbi:hypothetical protein IVA80_15165 [Bradyrhizobium sp. 139]|uniref:hypothetical protein n=1 Tax=Bradyrhizobium sp. 139 TaxID=2782616 RepID=UPI001FFABA6C|nr:hypothetical protein [Bradyrhizobium sp. 139]MCK1742163.1 hypothetical protein [Bradyrhizobium sp. 139]
MARDEALSLLSSEFKLWGVPFTHHDTPGGHIELRWRATPDKEWRQYFIAKTGSDHRGWLNARSDIRRLFKQDGLSLKEPPKKQPLLHKALSVPQHVEPHHDQLKMLRAEVADLSALVLELTHRVEDVLTRPQHTATALPEAVVPPVAVEVAEPVLTKTKQPYRTVPALDFVAESWNSLEALAKSMGVPAVIAKRKLYYLLQKGEVETQGDRWRKVPKAPAVVTPTSNPLVPVPAATALDFFTAEWVTTERLAEVMGISQDKAYGRAYYWMTKGKVEFDRGRWRLKLTKPNLRLVKPDRGQPRRAGARG